MGELSLALARQAQQLDRARGVGIFRQGGGAAQQLDRAVERAIADRVLRFADQPRAARRIGLARRRLFPGCHCARKRAARAARLGNPDRDRLRFGSGADLELAILGEEQRKHRPASAVTFVFDRAQFGDVLRRAQRIASLGAEGRIKRQQPDVQFAPLRRERTQHLHPQIEVNGDHRALAAGIGPDIG